MRKLAPALALAVLLSPVLALAQAGGADALKGRFTPQEQILLAGLLADPSSSQEFVHDGAGDNAAFQTKWRARLAAYSSGYMARQHPLNEKAHSLKEAVEPGQWAMLMATMRALKSSSSWTDQAKLKIFLGMIEDADDGLKNGDAHAAHKVESTAGPKLADAMKEYLATPAAKQAIADELKRQDAEAQAARDQAAKDQADKDRLAKEQPAETQPAAKPSTQPVSKPKPVVTPPQDAQRDPAHGAKDQLENADRSRDAGKVMDGGGGNGPAQIPPVRVTPGGGGGAPSIGLVKPGPVPDLTVKPGVPSPSVKDDDDMAELRGMKKDAKGGWRKYGAAGLGALLGGLLGFFIAGPIGAAAGAVLLGGGAFLGAKHLWG